VRHDKLSELLLASFTDYSAVESQLQGYDACFYCLGVSAAGMKETDYYRVTYDYALSAAEVLVKVNTAMTFIYVSGTGTDSSERGRWMWARVKGKTENALLRLPFKAAYMFRPGYIQPLHGARSKTLLYRMLYSIVAPFYPFLRCTLGGYVITTEDVGRAMLQAARHGAPRSVLENADLAELSGKHAG
jgi:hypothetical protein